MITAILGAAGRLLGAEVGAEALSAASIKSAVKHAAIEKVKSGIYHAPGAIFDAVGGNKVPLLRHGAAFVGQVRDTHKENQSKSEDRLDRDGDNQSNSEARLEHAKEKREIAEEKNAQRQRLAHEDALRSQGDESTRILTVISNDIAEIKEVLLRPKDEMKEGGGGGGLLSSLVSIAALQALATSVLGAEAGTALGGKLGAALRGQFAAPAPAPAPEADTAGRAPVAAPVATPTPGILGRLGELAARTVGAMFMPGVGQFAGAALADSAGWPAGRSIDEGTPAKARAKAQRAALVAKTPELSGTSDTSLSLSSLATSTQGKPKTVADLLSILVNAATSEDEGIYIRPANISAADLPPTPPAPAPAPASQPTRETSGGRRSDDQTVREVNERAMNSGQRSGYEPPVLSNRTGMPAAMTGVDAFADLVGRAESKNDYSAFNDTYTDQSGRRRVKAHYNTNLTSMTLGEVMARQKAGEIFAAGRYQVIPNTLQEAVQNLGLDPSQKFDQALQDRIFKEYLITQKRPEIGALLAGKGSVGAAMLAASQEWAGLGVAPGTRLRNGRIARGGESYYAGDGLNAAGTTPEQVRAALLASRDAARNPAPNMQTPSGNFLASLNQTLSGPKPQQSSLLYDANRRAEAADNRPIIVQPAPVIAQPPLKSRNSGRDVGAAQVPMNTRNPDPAIRQYVLGWMGSTV